MCVCVAAIKHSNPISSPHFTNSNPFSPLLNADAYRRPVSFFFSFLSPVIFPATLRHTCVVLSCPVLCVLVHAGAKTSQMWVSVWLFFSFGCFVVGQPLAAGDTGLAMWRRFTKLFIYNTLGFFKFSLFFLFSSFRFFVTLETHLKIKNKRGKKISMKRNPLEEPKGVSRAFPTENWPLNQLVPQSITSRFTFQMCIDGRRPSGACLDCLIDVE